MYVALSALEVCSRQGAIQIHVYLTFLPPRTLPRKLTALRRRLIKEPTFKGKGREVFLWGRSGKGGEHGKKRPCPTSETQKYALMVIWSFRDFAIRKLAITECTRSLVQRLDYFFHEILIFGICCFFFFFVGHLSDVQRCEVQWRRQRSVIKEPCHFEVTPMHFFLKKVL